MSGKSADHGDVSVPTVTYSDAAKRCSDIVTMHIAAGQAGRWCAIRLSDGGSDGVVYDTRSDAIRHQLHETLCAYVQIPRDSMPPEHAERFLAFHRKCYDAGFRLSDPDDRREPIMPYTLEGFQQFMKGSR